MTNLAYDDDETHVQVDIVDGKTMLRSGWVQRYHQTPELAGLQNNAEHQWRVAALLLRYCTVATLTLVREGLLHDTGEIISGDVSGLSKSRYPEIGLTLKPIEARARMRMGAPTEILTPLERDWLQWADITECVGFMRMRRPDLEGREDWRKTVNLSIERGLALGLSRTLIEESLG